MPNSLDPHVAARAIELRKHFYVPADLASLLSPLERFFTDLGPVYVPPVKTFLDSIRASIQTVSAPFLLVAASAQSHHYQRLNTAERIRSLNIEAEPGEAESDLEARREHAAEQRTSERMTEFRNSAEGVNAGVSDTASILLHALENDSFAAVPKELLMQATVGAWSALEVLARDEIIAALNRNPKLAIRLYHDPAAKRRFELPRFSLDDLASTGFDLSEQMGNLLIGGRDMSDLPSLKLACEALLPSDALRQALDEPLLWRLNQDRHLVVHRRGIVDQAYLDKTGAPFMIGAALDLSPDDLDRYFELVVAVGSKFLDALSTEPAVA